MAAPTGAFISQGPAYMDSEDIASVNREYRATAERPVGNCELRARNNTADTRIDVSISKPSRHYAGDGKKERRRASVCVSVRMLQARPFFSSGKTKP